MFKRQFFILLLGLLLAKEASVKDVETLRSPLRIVKNNITFYGMEGFSKIFLKEEFSIDTEKIPEIITTIGSFDADEEGNIYIFDYKLKKIAKFDKSGKYLVSFSREGEGPGELQSCSDINANLQEIVATDPGNSKFLVFKNDGTLKKN